MYGLFWDLVGSWTQLSRQLGVVNVRTGNRDVFFPLRARCVGRKRDSEDNPYSYLAY